MQLLTIVDGGLGAGRPEGRALGRLVASAEWLVAYLAGGAADEVVVLACEAAVEAAVRAELSRYGVADPRPRLSFRAPAELPDLLRALPAALLFLPDPQLARAKRAVRLLCPERTVPVVGLTHTLSTDATRWDLEAAALEGLDPCDALICTSRAARTLVAEVMGAAAARLGRPVPALDLPVVPLGVFPSRLAAPRQARAGEGRPTVLVHGRLSVAGKMDLVPLLDHWAEVARRSGVRPRLVLSGSPDDAGTLRAYQARVAQLGLSEDVSLVTGPSDAERAALLAGADVFCAPSDNLQETFGLSVVEALAAGLPVVAADWDGYRDLLDDGVEGFLVPTRWGRATRVATALGGLVPEGYRSLLTSQQIAVEPEVLVDRLARLLADPALRRRMGQAATARAARFTWPEVVRRHDEVFLGALARARAGGVAQGSGRELCDDFGHFATALLGPEDRLMVTPRGAAVLEGRQAAFHHVALPWLPVLARLSFTSSPAGRTVQELLAPLGDDWLARERGLSALLWMLKRGWLVVVPGVRP